MVAAECPFWRGYCSKSRKSDNPKNLAKVDLWVSLLLRRFSTPLRRSVIDLDETIWSLTSSRVKRISGSKNFRSPPQKDFCNNIEGTTDVPCKQEHFHFGTQSRLQNVFALR